MINKDDIERLKELKDFCDGNLTLDLEPDIGLGALYSNALGQVIAHLDQPYQLGDEVMVWDTYGGEVHRLIFICFVPDSEWPYLTVTDGDEQSFREGNPFNTTSWVHCKPIKQTVNVALDEGFVSDIKNEGNGHYLKDTWIADQLRKAIASQEGKDK